MSRFSKSFTSHLLNERTTGDFPLEVKYTKTNDVSMFLKQKFVLEARFQASAWVEQETANDSAKMNETIKEVKDHLIEQMFGEFRPIIIEMRCALHDRDSVRLRNLLAELEQKMFYE